MYFERKIDQWLLNWKKKEHKSPALVVGIRQCGKTKSILKFAETYANVIKINFWDNPEYCSDFNGKLDVDTIVSNIALHFPDAVISPKDTLLFFDEIQECPRARLSLKNFELDGRFDVVASGSYLGINGYVVGDATPAPTGYEEVFHMFTMDFEEFLWANGFTKKQIADMEKHFLSRGPMPEPMHAIFKEQYLKYACVGGFPKAVKAYIQNGRSIMEAYRVNQSTLFDMKTDFGRRKGKDGLPLFKPAEVARIQNTFDLIPFFLAKENKRFVLSKIASGRTEKKSDAVEYLVQSHIVHKVHNLDTPSLPLEGNAIKGQFKLFPEDIGIVTSMFGLDTLVAMNQGNLGLGKGAIYEALAFETLNKAEIPTYYFAKESGLEIDFVIAYQSQACLVEVKARTGNAKSSKTVMAHPEHYGPTRLIKIGDYNIGEENNILTIPQYMTFLLGRRSELL